VSITYIIIGITVLVSMIAFSNESLLGKLILNPYLVNTKGQYYRFLTSGFIHGNYTHLFFNMFSLFFFGQGMEHIFNLIFGEFGGVVFIALYLLAIVASDIPTYLKNKNNPSYNSLGASGGISAIIFAFIIFEPLESICIYVALCMPGFIFGTLYTVFSYYQGKRSNSNINHDAHLYGALFGLLFCIITYPAAIPVFIQQVTLWVQSKIALIS
jgi:membrane associated rhomboid family serine protease